MPARKPSLALVALLGVLAASCRSTQTLGSVEGPAPAPVESPASVTSPAPAEAVTPQQPAPALVSRATVPKVRVFRRPGASRPFVSFPNPDKFLEPTVFLVREGREGWLRVLVPMRPNGSTGWIRERDVRVVRNPFRIVVETEDNRLTVLKRGRVVERHPVAVGTGGTPTPEGLFYITSKIRTPDPGGVYGPWAFALSAFSEVLFSFAGGDGQVAIHGTNSPSLIGQDVSNGCIRMHNDAIRSLARTVPAGTPVRIRS